MRSRALVVPTVLALALVMMPVSAGGSDLDTTFGPGGVGQWRVTCCFDAGNAALQPDGKIVAIGRLVVPEDDLNNFMLYRLTPDGLLDGTFSGDGLRRLNFGGGTGEVFDSGEAVALQPDGRTVAVGLSRGPTQGPDVQPMKIAVARLLGNGRLDGSFGDGGRVLVLPPSGITFRHWHAGQGPVMDAALRPDGRILITAAAEDGSGRGWFATASLMPDGSLDGSWGKDGFVVTDPDRTSRDAFPTSLTILSDGRVVVGGWSGSGGALLRYRAGGRLDRRFDGDGRLALPQLARLTDVLRAGRGKLVVAGLSRPWTIVDPTFGNTIAGYRTVTLLRRLRDGAADPRFGRGGAARARLGSPLLGSAHAVRQPSGRLVVATSVFDRVDPDACEFGEVIALPGLARFRANGRRDGGFSGDGIAMGRGPELRVADLLVQASGALVAEGRDACPWRQPDAQIARFPAD